MGKCVDKKFLTFVVTVVLTQVPNYVMFFFIYVEEIRMYKMTYGIDDTFFKLGGL